MKETTNEKEHNSSRQVLNNEYESSDYPKERSTTKATAKTKEASKAHLYLAAVAVDFHQA